MREVATIDRELRNLASLRWVLRECKGSPSARAELVARADLLLDERNAQHPTS